jgi:hypothetical protein
VFLTSHHEDEVGHRVEAFIWAYPWSAQAHHRVAHQAKNACRRSPVGLPLAMLLNRVPNQVVHSVSNASAV